MSTWSLKSQIQSSCHLPALQLIHSSPSTLPVLSPETSKPSLYRFFFFFTIYLPSSLHFSASRDFLIQCAKSPLQTLNFLTLVSLHCIHLAQTQLWLNQTVCFTLAKRQLNIAEENYPAPLDELTSNLWPEISNGHLNCRTVFLQFLRTFLSLYTVQQFHTFSSL